MENRKTVFDIIGQIFTIFGFTVICLIVFVYIFGEDAKGYSTIFSFGDRGLSLSTLAQFMLTSTMIALFRYIFFTDIILKNTSMTIRAISMFSSVIVMIVLFVWLFGWFPMKKVMAWVMFILCFVVCAGVSMFISVIKEKIQNRKMQEALEKLQREEI